MNKELIFNILLYIYTFVAVYQIFHWLFFYLRVFTYKNKNKNTETPPVSVIIAARNEAANLEKNLINFLEQDYPEFRVIVVNDASTDDSDYVLAQFLQKYKNLYYTTLPNNTKFKHGKKTALTVGIKAAETELLIFSDADCKPESKKWISSIVQNFDKSTDFVIGYGPYEHKKGLVNKIVRSDTVLIALQYIGFALTGIPYMAVGRNMAYKKSVFLKAKGFAGQMNLLSGSDDLFVNQNATKKNTKVEISKESFVISKPVKNLGEWQIQKIRHLTTAKYYKLWHKILLGFEPLSRALFFVSAIILLLLNLKFFEIILGVLILRFILTTTFLIIANKKFNEKNLLIVQIIYEILQPVVNFVMLFFARKKKEFLWK